MLLLGRMSSSLTRRTGLPLFVEYPLARHASLRYTILRQIPSTTESVDRSLAYYSLLVIVLRTSSPTPVIVVPFSFEECSLICK